MMDSILARLLQSLIPFPKSKSFCQVFELHLDSCKLLQGCLLTHASKTFFDESQSSGSDTNCSHSSEASLDTTMASGSGHILSEKRAPAQRNPIQRKKVYFFETKLLEADSSNPLCCLSKTMISYRERISKSDCGTNRTRPKTKSSHVFNYFNRFHGQSRVTETLKQRFIRVSVWIHTILLHF